MGIIYHDGPVSDHFDGLRFANLYGPTVDHGPRDLWRWRGQRRAPRWPPALRPLAADHPPPRADRPRIAFVGHATLLIQVAGCNVLVDPVWSDRASPLAFAGPRRHQPPGIAWADLPRIDVVLITHGHYDHLDIRTLTALWRRDRPRIIAPLGQDVTIRLAAEALRVEIGDWWDERALSADLTVAFVPAIHWSARTLSDRRRALWCGYALHTPAGLIYLAGDTGYGSGALSAEIGRRRGAPMLAVLPIGAYEPAWFMQPQHMNPAEAVDALLGCGAAAGWGIHWGTFQLSDEARDAPPAALAAARAARGLRAERFPAAQPGEVWQA